MSQPTKYDHEICAGEDYHFDLTFKDDDNLPLDLTDFVITCKIFDCLQQVRSVAEVEIPDPLLGQAFFKFPEQQTRFLRGLLHCSVRVVGITGFVQFAIDGDAKIKLVEGLPDPILIGGQILGNTSVVDG